MPSLTIEFATEAELERAIAYFAEMQSVASGAVKAVWGDTKVAKSRVAAGREAILTRGKIGRERWQAEMIAEMPAGRSTDPLHMAAYLAKHPTRLDYAERLAEGRSIGSRAEKGAVKQLLDLHEADESPMEVEHVGPLVELTASSEPPNGMRFGLRREGVPKTIGPLIGPQRISRSSFRAIRYTPASVATRLRAAQFEESPPRSPP